jgi:hypothetical protein
MSRKLNLPQTDIFSIYSDSGQPDLVEMPYLSYSQISKWLKSKREYIRKYFLGEPDDNEGLQRYGDFGHKVGGALEHNDYSGFEPDEIEFLKTVPRYDRFEVETLLKMDGFFVKGYIDTMKLPDDHKGSGHIIEYVPAIADYKTGDISKKEEDYASDDYIQLEIYAASIEQVFGSLPEKADVLLIGRSGNAFKGEELKLTKEFITIKKDITPERIEEVKKLVQKVAEEISDYYTTFQRINGLI